MCCVEGVKGQMIQDFADTKVLVMFRSPVMTEAFGQLFAQMPGVNVVGKFNNVGEALNSLSVSSPDVIITGANDEELNPTELIDGINKINCGTIPILVFTTRSGHEPALVLRSVMSGVSGYVSTNIDIATLKCALLAARHGLTVLGPEARAIVDVALSAASRTGLLLGQEDNLTAREQQVLRLMINSRTNKEIAAQLAVGVRTIEMHVAHIVAKLHVRSRTEAAMHAARLIGVRGEEATAVVEAVLGN